ncbi:lipoprotein [Lysobacter sp. CFH 32150]|uniref:LPS translocon maturation chaperone LptM n=1 Tax=Lysobacter sp. CFH 32150 TaxID=2927128 RepID=UPI001FA76D9D|nr:lipoprotein [Lysobacter sp. CFH 32150]MCI4568178.1 lipoprotein [Lysobacter sp. CFH 32150]
MNTNFKAGTLIAALIASSLLLSGCGNKGPLVLPTAPVEVPPPEATPAEAAPAAEPTTDATAPEAPTPVEEGQPEAEPATPPSDDGNG